MISKLIQSSFANDSDQVSSLRQVITVSKNCMFLSFLRLFESLLLKNETRKSLFKREQEKRDREETKQAFAKLSTAASED